jgi:Protein of unknown function (DUF2752)
MTQVTSPDGSVPAAAPALRQHLPAAPPYHPHPASPYHQHAAPRLVLADDPASRLVARLFGRSPVWVGPLAILFCFATGVAYALATDPTHSTAAANPTCLVKLTTGFDCPGCGGTRAFWYLLHGDLPAAARSHLIAIFAAPFLIYMYVAWAANLVFKRKLPVLRVTPRMMSLFLAAWAVFTVLRNLPWAPFTWFFV